MKVLFTNCVFNDQLIERLKTANIEIVPGKKGGYTEDELVTILRDFDCFICGAQGICTRRVIEENKHLKLVSFFGTGYQQYVGVEAAKENNIPVSYAPGANARAVAEYTVALIENAVKKISLSGNQVKSGIWEKYETFDLENKTLGIVGMGKIGSHVARIMCDGFGMNLVYNSLESDPEIDSKYGITMSSLDEVFEKSDVISINATCTEENKGMITKEQLEKVKPGAILVNTARQQLIVKEDLLDAIKNGKLGFVAMDGFYEEPINENDEFLKLPDDKFLLTPHNAYNSTNAIRKMEIMLIESLADALNGRPIRHQVE
jgi:phosphoglycerate dehydrogenase-like enzyme